MTRVRTVERREPGFVRRWRRLERRFGAGGPIGAGADFWGARGAGKDDRRTEGQGSSRRGGGRGGCCEGVGLVGLDLLGCGNDPLLEFGRKRESAI